MRENQTNRENILLQTVLLVGSTSNHNNFLCEKYENENNTSETWKHFVHLGCLGHHFRWRTQKKFSSRKSHRSFFRPSSSVVLHSLAAIVETERSFSTNSTLNAPWLMKHTRTQWHDRNIYFPFIASDETNSCCCHSRKKSNV